MSPRHPLKRLVGYARGRHRLLWVASICSILNKIFDLAPPALIGAAIDVVVEREASMIARLGFESVTEQLWALAGLTVVIWGLESVFEYAYGVLWRHLAQDLQHNLRLDAYGHVQRLEMAYFEDQSTGGLMSILNDDINQLERFLDGGANDLLQVGTTVVVISTAFFALAPGVAWMALLPMPFILWGSMAFQRRIAPRYAEVRERAGEVNGLLSNNLSGIATIKSFTAEGFEVERVEAASAAYREANRRAIRLSSAFSPLIRMVIVVGFTATLVVGGELAFSGSLAVGSYGVMVFLTQRLLWPLTRLGQTFDLYQRAMASTARVLDLLDTAVSIEGGQEALEVGAVRGEVVFEAVTFAYPGRPPVLKDFSLRVEAGQTVAIVGSTGSGKTTLVNLLLRFYDAGSGRILLDGRDIKGLRLGDLRGAVGLVSQQVFLFQGSVRENIAYGGAGSAAADRIEAAGQAAEAHGFIERLPGGYEAVIGERGQKLSGGQRQRMSIARALYKDPPVLILDEATSAVDNETEAAIQRSLSRITAGRTTIVIAPRLSTIRSADRIIVMEEGEVRESGRHEALLAEGGIYAQLWRVQTGERAL